VSSEENKRMSMVGRTLVTTAKTAAQWIWRVIRSSSIWRMLRRMPFLRSGLYLAVEIWRRFSETKGLSKEMIDREFRLQDDPFQYNTTPSEGIRFVQQAKILDSVQRGNRFQRALEIGCAEGIFTEIMAERSQSLMVLDISPTALAKTRQRKNWGDYVHFQEWDLQHDAVPGTFDLIVAAGVLEYLYGLRKFRKVRAKLVAALCPAGYLLVQSTRANPVVENAWWGKYIIRGERINKFFSQDKKLQVMDWVTTDNYVITLFRRASQSHDSVDCHPNVQS
jgi:2-polyprenyl-3-methyl-5-hydroxy-6-metoxy-1,4-benzoquinol methylase